MKLDVPGLTLSRFRSKGYSLLIDSQGAAAASNTAQGPVKATKRPTALRKCGYVNPQLRGRIQIPKEQMDRLRSNNGTAQVSPAKQISPRTPPDPMEWPDPSLKDAVAQDVTLKGHTIRVIRPTDADLRRSTLPSMSQLREAIRTVPLSQLQHTRKMILRTKGDSELRGLSGRGVVELFPVDVVSADDDSEMQKEDLRAYRENPQGYFDSLVMHECGHNYSESLWKDTGSDEWWEWAKHDMTPASGYAIGSKGDKTGEDFCEFLVLYNAAVGTPCQDMLQQIYPNRWQLLNRYLAGS